MADITMCSGKDCPLKEECYRHTAPVNEYRQAYFNEPPYDKVKKKCIHFDNIKK